VEEGRQEWEGRFMSPAPREGFPSDSFNDSFIIFPSSALHDESLEMRTKVNAEDSSLLWATSSPGPKAMGRF
jgi:hypothetical protein